MIYTTAKQDYHTKVLSDVAFALTASDYKDPPTITKTWDGSDVCSTLTANNAGGEQRMPDKQNFNAVIERKGGDGMMDVSATNTAVRRLTPL